MISNFHAIVTYDGTHYFGWQTTKTGPSIQETLTIAIQKATQEDSIPEAASRTDRGVHARGQSIAFSLTKPWDPYRLTQAINAYLPKDIRILELKIAPSDFHPTLQASSKEYHYSVSLEPFQRPTHRLYSWHFPYPLNLSLMEEAAKLLIGKHDFSAFSNKKCTNPICTLFSIEFVKTEEKFQIILKGDRFLYKMARTLAGTLLYIGCKKLSFDCIPSLFALKDRKKAGVTAPAHGLFLHRVVY